MMRFEMKSNQDISPVKVSSERRKPGYFCNALRYGNKESLPINTHFNMFCNPSFYSIK